MASSAQGVAARRQAGAHTQYHPLTARTFQLVPSSLDIALRTLDEVEGAVRGLYRRVEVVTTAGTLAWVYEYGADPTDHFELTPLTGGDWLNR